MPRRAAVIGAVRTVNKTGNGVTNKPDRRLLLKKGFDMQILCPNCKASSDLMTIESVDYIQCPECGWFQTQADGSMAVCEPPSSTLDHPPEPEPEPEPVPPHEPAASESQGGPSDPPASPPCDDPDSEDDEDSVNVIIHFED